jgi:cobalt-precorrin 5A hydrolase
MIAIGIGANSTAQADDFSNAIADIARETQCDVIATLEGAVFADLLRDAAARRSIAYRALPLDDLRARNDDCRTRSQRTLDLFGLASVAESSALAAAGPGSKLLMPRRSLGNITMAAARSNEPKENSQ